ncbi:phage tail terminator protein [Pectobacterium cacticida]|uniref:phage tail terminator protein n=1 Tax=Pectobacterium cacticida TaxID=69221 RepID=UPI0039885BCC
MKKHIDIRASAMAAVQTSLSNSGVTGVVFFDGRPGFIDAKDVPAVAVYITDAEASERIDSFCGGGWEATLHIEVFLKSSSPDTELDSWTDQLCQAVLNSDTLSGMLISIIPSGYDYQRDEEMMTWGSSDLRFAIAYTI